MPGSSRPLAIRITFDQDSSVRAALVAGWLEDDAVVEADRVLSGYPGLLRLDLTELKRADAAGLDLLRALRARGVHLTGVSPFMRLLLNTETSGPPARGEPKGSKP